MSGLIIAGISGAGKTTTFRRVAAQLASQQREILCSLPQAMTTTAHLHLASDPQLQAREVLGWANGLVSFWEDVHRRALPLRDEPYASNWVPTLLIEGFVFDIPLHDFAIERADVSDIERRLHRLDVRLAVLRVSPARIKQQCVEATREHRGAGWFRHLEKLGQDDDERAAHFRRQQELLLRWAAESPLAHVVVDTDSQDWDTIAQHVAALVQ